MLGLEDGPGLGKDLCRDGSADPGKENFSGSRWESSLIYIVLANDWNSWIGESWRWAKVGNEYMLDISDRAIMVCPVVSDWEVLPSWMLWEEAAGMHRERLDVEIKIGPEILGTFCVLEKLLKLESLRGFSLGFVDASSDGGWGRKVHRSQVWRYFCFATTPKPKEKKMIKDDTGMAHHVSSVLSWNFFDTVDLGHSLIWFQLEWTSSQVVQGRSPPELLWYRLKKARATPQNMLIAAIVKSCR